MTLSPAALLSELEPTAARLVERHLTTSKEWFPHELVPWGRAREFDPERGWQPEDSDVGEVPLSEAARSALYVNLLTEDNLPYYFNAIDRVFGTDDAYGYWTRRWTAEEGRHAIAIRDYLTVSRAIDPWELERARMAQVTGANTPKPQTPQIGFCYLAMHKGEWDGKRIVPEAYYDFAWTPCKVKNDYGAQWWTFPSLANGPADLVITRGKDINHGFVIPSLDLVFVRLGDGTQFPKEFERDLVTKVSAAVEK